VKTLVTHKNVTLMTLYQRRVQGKRITDDPVPATGTGKRVTDEVPLETHFGYTRF
jgi:hypothetical protein